ncbi:hypothetical protein MBLNU457_5763t2 [Dothideomycetes sp. NU457]
MDKVLKRTQNALRNAARKKARQQVAKDRDELYHVRQTEKMHRLMMRKIVKDEQHNRKEDWRLGPRLAPRRDIGEAADKYATIHQALIQPPNKTAKYNKDFVCHLSPEDRVVVLVGRDKGKIGRVSTINEEAQTVKVQGMNQADYYVPDFMRIEDNFDRSILPINLDIPMTDVRLVIALEDDEGHFRDVVVDKVVVNKPTPYQIKQRGADKRGVRTIFGTDKEIPWPPTEEPEHEPNGGVDTRQVDIDPVTFRPSLLTMPMPSSVIDELRGKYSPFRTRHDPEYIKRKEAQAVENPRVKVLAKIASTPMQELIARNKKEREERQKDLTEEQLAAIGEVIAREQGEVEPVRATEGAPQTQTS